MTDSEQSDSWVKASAVEVGDRVLHKSGWLQVTHSQQTTGGDGTWMLRFAHGVRYDHPDAPLAVRAGAR